MSCRNHFASLFNLIFPCLNFITELFSRSNPNDYVHQDSCAVSDLPSSVIFDILAKLPIKSIIRCKCVCKTWNNLILDSHFASIYLKNLPFSVLVISQHVIVDDRFDESFFFLEIGLNGDVIRTPFNPKALEFPRNGILGITGSCNGLLCLQQSPRLENDGYYVQNRDSIYNNQTVYIMNPVLGEFMVLPQVNRSENMSNVVYGFGFSTQSDHYKVLRFVSRYIFVGLGHEYGIHGEIFTVGVDHKWRSFEDSSIPFYLFSCGITLNRALHLVGDDRRSGFIFAFDLEEEKGHRIPLPSRLGDEPGNVVLAECNGKLCLSDNSTEHQVVIWTMKEYGVVESWSREIILKRWIPIDLRPYPLIPITTLRNGDLLLSHQEDLPELGSSDLISFNSKTMECSKLKLEVSNSGGAMSFLLGYAPSFIPLNTVI